MTFWRDVDLTQPKIGWSLSLSGGAVLLGRRLYRWTWRRLPVRPVVAARRSA